MSCRDYPAIVKLLPSRVTCWALLLSFLPLTYAASADWPQFLGPHRNGHVPEVRLAERFAGSFQPRLVYPLGAGYAGPVVVGDRVILFHRVGHVERLEAIDVRNGQRLWHVEQPTDYQGGYNPDNGPRATPCVADAHVYCWGASGRLTCVRVQNGQVEWTRLLAEEYQAPEGYFGFGCAPIVVGDKVLVALGGRPDAGIVALNRHTGRTVWTATGYGVSYASPTLLEHNGQTTGLFLTRLHLVAVDVNSGRVIFEHPFGRSGLTVTGATPLVAENHVFATASYNIGAELVRLSPANSPQRVWASDDVLSSQYTTPVYYKGYLYGTHGREDSPTPAELRCVELTTGRVRWRKAGVGVAHVLSIGDKLLVIEVQNGDVVLVQATADRYVELDRRHVSDHVLRAPPAVAHGELWLRTWRSDCTGELLAFPLPQAE